MQFLSPVRTATQYGAFLSKGSIKQLIGKTRIGKVLRHKVYEHGGVIDLHRAIDLLL